MMIMRRLLDLLRADVHALLDSVEDKKLLLENCLGQMRRALEQDALELERLAGVLARAQHERAHLCSQAAPPALLQRREHNLESLRALCQERQMRLQSRIQQYEHVQVRCREQGHAVRLAPPLPHFSPFAWDFAPTWEDRETQGDSPCPSTASSRE
jgi:phage shock protein A